MSEWTWSSVVGEVPVRILQTSTDGTGTVRAHVEIASDVSPYRRGDKLRLPTVLLKKKTSTQEEELDTEVLGTM